MSDDPRHERAKLLAADVRAKAEELSTAIYQARKEGYHCSLRVMNATAVDTGDHDDDGGAFIGAGRNSMVILATVAFDLGGKVL
jgi:hypothetical protein